MLPIGVRLISSASKELDKRYLDSEAMIWLYGSPAMLLRELLTQSITNLMPAWQAWKAEPRTAGQQNLNVNATHPGYVPNWEPEDGKQRQRRRR